MVTRGTQLPTLRQLAYIVAVAELGHFGRAAKRCAVSQPALSRQVREVEELLGVVLFERVRPRALVTPPGRAFVAQARRVLLEAKELDRVVRASEHSLAGRLQLGVIPTIAPYLLPTLVRALPQTWPELQLVLREDKTESLLSAVRQGDLDVAVLALPVAGDDLAEAALFDEPFVLAAPPGHPLAQPRPVDAAELAGHALLLMAEGHCFRDHALEVCHAVGAGADPNVVATSLTTLMLMVQGGLGATLLPASALTALPAGGAFVLRAFAAEPGPRRAVGLRWRPTSPRTDAFRALGRAMREHVSQLNARLPDTVHGPRPAFVVRGG